MLSCILCSLHPSQMVFAGDSLYYTSELWKELTQHRDKFMSEEVIYQYLGYIKTHTKLLPKHAGLPRERKLFYSVSTLGVQLSKGIS